MYYEATAPRIAASPTKSSAASDDFRVYTAHPFPPVLFEDATKPLVTQHPPCLSLAHSPNKTPPSVESDWIPADVLNQCKR